MSTSPRLWLVLRITLGLLLLALAAVVGFAAGRVLPVPAGSLPLLPEALSLIEDHYLRPLPGRDVLGRGAVRGLVQSLEDPYSLLVDPAGHELETDTLTGSYGGIGADVLRDSQGLLHLVPFPDGPASRAGIVEAEVLSAIDGVALYPQTSMDEVTSRLRGTAGSPVTLTVGPTPGDPAPRDVRLVRETFPLPSVTGYLLPDDPAIGVVRLTLFTAATPSEVDAAVGDLTARGAAGILLDLRGNPGGLFDSAVDTARLWLKEGPMVSEVDVDGSGPTFAVQTPGRWAALPLVLLVDGGTASSAEVLAGVLQQRGRASLVGLPTFGKGSVQSVFPLGDGSSLHLTTAVWKLADGRELPSGGLVPDVEVHLDPSDPGAGLLEAAARLREETDLP